MALPTPPPNSTPIINNPFYWPDHYAVQSVNGPLIVGSGLTVLDDSLSATGGGGVGVASLTAGPGIFVSSSTGNVTIANTGVVSLIAGGGISITGSGGNYTITNTLPALGVPGTVTQVNAGPGLSGGPITTSGTIGLAPVPTVSPGTYPNATVSVDTYGRITAIYPGSGGGAGVTSITAGNGLTGGTITSTGTIGLPNFPGVAGGYVNANITVDGQGRITSASNGTGGTGTVTSIIAGAGLSGGTITTTGTIALDTIPGVAGSYTNANVTVDSQGRITSVTNGSSGGSGTVTSIVAGTGLSGGTITTSGTISLPGVGANGTFANPASITVDLEGRVTSATAGVAAIPCSSFVSKGQLLAGTGLAFPSPAFSTLNPGTDGQVLTACAACAEGLYWTTPGGGASPATPTVEGIVYGCTDNVSFNYGLGDQIFGALTTGTANVAIGAGALLANDAGATNVAVGIAALNSNTSGGQNVAIGPQALFANTTFGSNIAIGTAALVAADGGDCNTALGNFAGSTVTTGACNILLGAQAGGSGPGALDTGSENIIIGNNLSVATSGGNCQLAIGMGILCWLSGDSTFAIRPGAGIVDCAGSCGTVGQVLSSTGLNSIEWVPAGGGGGSPATPTVAGLVLGCTVANNVGLGCNSFLALTTGLNNVAAGQNALCSLTTGNANVAIGNNSLLCNVSGIGNVAVGNIALCCNTANGNTAVGTGALRLNTTGASNTAVGSNAMICNQTGSCNVAVGALAQTQVCNGSRNVAVGYCTMPGLAGGTSVGSDNVVVGLNNMLNFTTACQNVAIGNCALSAPRTGNGNVAIGHQAGSAVFGDDNIAIGRNALVGPLGIPPATGPIRNVAIGVDAGRCVTTGECNVFIGPGAGCGCTIESRCLVIAFSPTESWLTGNDLKAIKPSAGVIDCANSCGTANMVLTSQGNAVQWKSVSSAIAAPNYGSFFDTSTQTNVTPSVGIPVRLNTTDIANNFSVVTNSRVTAAAAGTYNLQFSIQLSTSTASLQSVEIWLVKNGTAVPNSNTQFVTKGAGEEAFAALNYVVQLTAGQYVELYWASSDANMTLASFASLYGGPAIPSALVTIVPVGA